MFSCDEGDLGVHATDEVLVMHTTNDGAMAKLEISVMVSGRSKGL